MATWVGLTKELSAVDGRLADEHRTAVLASLDAASLAEVVDQAVDAERLVA